MRANGAHNLLVGQVADPAGSVVDHVRRGVEQSEGVEGGLDSRHSDGRDLSVEVPDEHSLETNKTKQDTHNTITQ